ncbi:MAG TPA: hypothetical protein VFS66_15335 [Acidimicrobiia bacterium]|nr:hypothetical protein [Acidimicrobiia bacterium]
MRRTIAALAVLTWMVAACSTPDPQAAPPPSDGVPLCTDVPAITADPALYRDTPKYVANEMPIDAVSAWAMEQPGYAGIWIDRDHNGWLTVAFTENVDARQTEIETLWPNDGVVAVAVEATEEDLSAIQQRAHEELPEIIQGSGSMINYGVVSLHVGFLTEENIAAVEEAFAGEPVCIEGADPAQAVPEGPQPEGGDGWRLLVDEDEVGLTYRTGIAWDHDSLNDLIATIPELDIEPPDVEFETEVVIWFGAVHGSSCPNLRLDDVVVNGSLVYADIVETSNQMACTSDAIPHTYLVAVDRDRLPEAPFHIQLDSNDPPAGVPEERTVVEADLRQRGSIAEPGEVGFDANLPGPKVEQSGAIIETGFPWSYEIDLACGMEWLGEVNSYRWVASTELPQAWLDATKGADSVVVEIVLNEGDPPFVEVTFEGDTVTYIPGDAPSC